MQNVELIPVREARRAISNQKQNKTNNNARSWFASEETLMGLNPKHLQISCLCHNKQAFFWTFYVFGS